MTYDEFRNAMLENAATCAQKAAYHKRRQHVLACVSFIMCIIMSATGALDAWFTARFWSVAFDFASAGMNLYFGLKGRRDGYRAQAEFLEIRTDTLQKLDEETRRRAKEQEEWGKLRDEWREED